MNSIGVPGIVDVERPRQAALRPRRRVVAAAELVDQVAVPAVPVCSARPRRCRSAGRRCRRATRGCTSPGSRRGRSRPSPARPGPCRPDPGRRAPAASRGGPGGPGGANRPSWTIHGSSGRCSATMYRSGNSARSRSDHDPQVLAVDLGGGVEPEPVGGVLLEVHARVLVEVVLHLPLPPGRTRVPTTCRWPPST